MSFSGVNARMKVVSGEPVPPAVIRFVQANSMIMLEHDRGQMLNKNGYLFLRFGRYSISIRTAFARDKLDGAEGIAFSAHVRRRRRHSHSETVIAMVVRQEAPGKPAKKETPLPVQKDGRGRN